jgi:hypothetical protein
VVSVPDAAADGIIGLRSVAQLLAQRNLVMAARPYIFACTPRASIFLF